MIAKDSQTDDLVLDLVSSTELRNKKNSATFKRRPMVKSKHTQAYTEANIEKTPVTAIHFHSFLFVSENIHVHQDHAELVHWGSHSQ